MASRADLDRLGRGRDAATRLARRDLQAFWATLDLTDAAGAWQERPHMGVDPVEQPLRAAVGAHAEFIKSGSLSRGERIAKYNRLLAIDAAL